MHENMDQHYVIWFTQKTILHLLYNAAPECGIMFHHRKIDEKSITSILPMAKAHLIGRNLEIVEKAYYFMKQALDDLCITHRNYALARGVRYGDQYKVNRQDVMSLAPEALYRAAIRFVPLEGSTPEDRKIRFQVYTGWWVRQTIQTSIPRKLQLTLDQGMTDDAGSSTFIDNVTENDTIWGGSKSVAEDDEAMEELRMTYCPHLSMEEMMVILYDPEKGAILMEQLGLQDVG